MSGKFPTDLEHYHRYLCEWAGYLSQTPDTGRSRWYTRKLENIAILPRCATQIMSVSQDSVHDENTCICGCGCHVVPYVNKWHLKRLIGIVSYVLAGRIEETMIPVQAFKHLTYCPELDTVQRARIDEIYEKLWAPKDGTSDR